MTETEKNAQPLNNDTNKVAASTKPRQTKSKQKATQDGGTVPASVPATHPGSGSTPSSLSVSAASQPEQIPKISERMLAKQRERQLKAQVAKELLASGFSIRDTSSETGLPKGAVERLSKEMRREESQKGGNPRTQFMNKPYEYAVKKLEEADDEDESLLDSGWFLKTQKKLLKMKFEMDMMKKMGLLGDDNNNGGDINVQKLLELKIVSSGGSTPASDLTAFAQALIGLKDLIAAGNKDPIDSFSKLENIKQAGIQNFKDLQQQAYVQAQQNANRGLLGEALNAVSPLAAKILSGQPRPPPPPPSEIPGPMPLPNQTSPPEGSLGDIISVETPQDLESLRLPTVEPGDATGYSNFELIRQKSELKGGT
jgi:hypothetical protein